MGCHEGEGESRGIIAVTILHLVLTLSSPLSLIFFIIFTTAVIAVCYHSISVIIIITTFHVLIFYVASSFADFADRTRLTTRSSPSRISHALAIQIHTNKYINMRGSVFQKDRKRGNTAICKQNLF